MISPCISICTLDDKTCTACGRTTDEIAEWRGANDEVHARILTNCVARLDEEAHEQWVNKYNAKVKRITQK